MVLRVIISILCSILFVQTSLAQEVETKRDSLRYKDFCINPRNTFVAGLPMFAASFVAKNSDLNFREMRFNHLPHFHNRTDDFLQFSPMVVMFGMKAFGVESRNSWGRMIVSDVFSAALMAGVVNGLKHGVRKTRPDNSNDVSFPSGHTATAFMCATMLHHEYKHLSPWVSICGYTAASCTGVMRMVNNKHWLSDVMAGAGIGIFTTEMGYLLADLIFKDRGLNVKSGISSELPKDSTPSFISLTFGGEVPLNEYEVSPELTIGTFRGVSVAAEGAWFWNHHLGAGCKFSAANLAYEFDGGTVGSNKFCFSGAHAGIYYSLPLHERIRFVCKVLNGFTQYNDLKIRKRVTVNPRNGYSMVTGVSFAFRLAPLFSYVLGCDYNFMPSYMKQLEQSMHALNITGGVRADF